MLFCIVGETSRGKDTFRKYLENKYNLKSVCSYTTRPMRTGEENGVQHKFISKNEAKIILHCKKDDIIAYTEIGEYAYFTTKKDLEESDIYIIEPDGVEYLRDNYKDLKLCVIYVTCSETICRQRAAERGDLTELLDKRIKSETERFEKFAESGNYDYKYENIGTLEEMYQYIDEMMIDIECRNV